MKYVAIFDQIGIKSLKFRNRISIECTLPGIESFNVWIESLMRLNLISIRFYQSLETTLPYK